MAFLYTAFSKLMTPSDQQTAFQISKGNKEKSVNLKGKTSKDQDHFLVQRSLKKRNSTTGKVVSNDRVYKVRPQNLKNMVEHSLRGNSSSPSSPSSPSSCQLRSQQHSQSHPQSHPQMHVRMLAQSPGHSNLKSRLMSHLSSQSPAHSNLKSRLMSRLHSESQPQPQQRKVVLVKKPITNLMKKENVQKLLSRPGSKPLSRPVSKSGKKTVSKKDSKPVAKSVSKKSSSKPVAKSGKKTTKKTYLKGGGKPSIKFCKTGELNTDAGETYNPNTHSYSEIQRKRDCSKYYTNNQLK